MGGHSVWFGGSFFPATDRPGAHASRHLSNLRAAAPSPSRRPLAFSAPLPPKKVDLRYGFFYDSYDSKYYYWESVVLVEKLLMVLAITLLQRKNATVQVLVALIIISLATVVQITFRPSGCNMLHTLTRASLYVLQCTLFLLMVSNLEEIATSDVVVAALVLAAVLNGALVLMFLYAFFVELRRMLLASVGKGEEDKVSREDVVKSLKSLASFGGGRLMRGKRKAASARAGPPVESRGGPAARGAARGEGAAGDGEGPDRV